MLLCRTLSLLLKVFLEVQWIKPFFSFDLDFDLEVCML
jgi:hypothetical protein